MLLILYSVSTNNDWLKKISKLSDFFGIYILEYARISQKMQFIFGELLNKKKQG